MGLHTSNELLKDYLDVIENVVLYIGPCTSRCAEVWIKYLLHGVPTHIDLETIRQQREGYCPSIKLQDS
jgi:hypothetical protein